MLYEYKLIYFKFFYCIAVFIKFINIECLLLGMEVNLELNL